MKKSKKSFLGWSLSILMAMSIFSSPMFTLQTSAATTRITMVAVGDDLMHSQVVKACKTSTGYNFNGLFKNIKSYVQQADVAVINQETILVGSNYSGYPSFGSPRVLADAIAGAGFDVVTHATNHTMDRGSNAILGTLNYWNSRFPQMKVLGIHKSQADADTVKVISKKGIRIAMLNYTYGLNGYSLPSGKRYMVDLLQSQYKAKIKKDIQKAKAVGDLVVVFAHWGTEYQYKPSSSQKSWAKFFADEGVDLVIGAHPHVLEPYTTVLGKNGNRMVVYYSLGNYVSNQKATDRILGGMAKIFIEKDENGARIYAYTMYPLVTHITDGYKGYTTYRLSDYTDALAKKNYIRKVTGKVPTVNTLKNLYRKITGKEPK